MKLRTVVAQDRGRELSMYGLLLALVVGGVAFQGCGDGHREKQQTSTAVAAGATVQGQGAVATPAVAEPRSVTSVVPSSELESVPPDIEVTIPDTLVTPGEPVELVVLATPDVNQIALYDGIGDKQSFVRDADGKHWRVTYRVPLRPRQERWGLSVTARNESNRWCRVWVFVHANRGTSGVAVSPDSGTTTTQ